ncbi:MAG: DUF2975 domain-containing protein [Lachnospiraceae bacterium]|nr:DUF2975 domain-containing protein [Lachnospiraceae bacterium]
MKQKTFSRWLKVILVGVALIGAFVYCYAVPELGKEIAEANPEFAYCFWPWLIFISLTAIPCYIALVHAWQVVDSIGKDLAFTRENAKHLSWISWLAAGDAAFFFVGNFVLGFLSMSHPGVLLMSLFVSLIGAAIAIMAAALSYLVGKAAELQDQSDLTI